MAGAAHLRGEHQKLLKGGARRQQSGGQHLVVGGLSGLNLLQLFQDLLRGGKAADVDGPHLRDPLGALQSALQLGQTALQLGQSVAHVVKVALQVPGDLGGLLVVGFDAVRQLFELFGVGLEVLDGRPGGGELGLEGHGVFRQGGEGAGGVGQGLRGGVQVAGQGGQGAVQGIQLGQSGVGAVIDLPLAAGDGAPGGVEPVQTAGGGAEAARSCRPGC